MYGNSSFDGQLLYDDEMGKYCRQSKIEGMLIFTVIQQVIRVNYQNTLLLTVFITYTKGRTYDSKEPLSSIPPLFGQFDINFTNKKFQLGTSFRFNSKKDIVDFNFTEGIDNHDLTPIVNENATEDIDKLFWLTKLGNFRI